MGLKVSRATATPTVTFGLAAESNVPSSPSAHQSEMAIPAAARPSRYISSAARWRVASSPEESPAIAAPSSLGMILDCILSGAKEKLHQVLQFPALAPREQATAAPRRKAPLQ